MTASAPTRPDIVLASQSAVRARLLTAAGIRFAAEAARLDEVAISAALAAHGTPPRDIADALADAKARKLADRHPDAVVVGCDQVLSLDGKGIGRPETRDAARSQLRDLRGRTHKLHTAVVLYHEVNPVWRHLGDVKLTMRDFNDAFIEAYLDRNWPGVADSVGAYKLEEEGIRLFQTLDGDYFTALGLPLLPLLGYLGQRGFIEA